MKGFSSKVLERIYFGQDVAALTQLALPDELCRAWIAHWQGDLQNAYSLSAEVPLEKLSAGLRELVELDRLLIGVKIGLQLPEHLPSRLRTRAGQIVWNYTLFSHYFWVHHGKAWSALVRMLFASLGHSTSRFWLTTLFLMGHMAAIRGSGRAGFSLAKLMHSLLHLARRSGRAFPRAAENIVLAAFPYTHFVSNRLSGIPSLMEKTAPLLTKDPYYQTIFLISGLYAFSYTGDVVRSEIFSSRFRELHQQGKLLRYEPISRIIPLLPFALRGYGHVIADEFWQLLSEHQPENFDPAINSQFYRITALISLTLGSYAEARQAIEQAIQFRGKAGFQSWQRFDRVLLFAANKRTRLDALKANLGSLALPNEAGLHTHFVFTQLIMVFSKIVLDPESFPEQLRTILGKHFDVTEIKLMPAIQDLFTQDPVIKIDQQYLVFAKLPPERALFIRNILIDLRPYLISIEKALEEVRKLYKQRENALKKSTAADMAQMLSHDLRAPLSTFERMLSLPPETELASQAPAIRSSLLRVHTLIESLRHLEEEGTVRRVLAPLHWERAQAALFARASMKNLRIEFSHGIDSPCSLDPIKFERAWVNLVSNAIDFARSTIRVETAREGACLYLRVWDDGPGVPDFFVPQLFTRGATFGKEDGTGLGLAYVQHVMRGHGGEVYYERRGGWTLFSCYVDHAFFEGEAIQMVGEIKRESDREDRAKVVGLCFSQHSLAQSLYQEVQRMESQSYRFSLLYADADIVVTNDPDLALTAAEEGKTPLEMNPRLEERAILERLIRRFDLVPS